MTGPWGRGSESVDNTREKRATVDNKRNPPVPHHPRQREVPLPAYLAPPGAQQGTACSSRKIGDGPVSRGNDSGPPHAACRTCTIVSAFSPALGERPQRLPGIHKS